MANGKAIRARAAVCGDVIGYYKGGKFHLMGTITGIDSDDNEIRIHTDNKKWAWSLHRTTIIRKVG